MRGQGLGSEYRLGVCGEQHKESAEGKGHREPEERGRLQRLGKELDASPHLQEKHVGTGMVLVGRRQISYKGMKKWKFIFKTGGRRNQSPGVAPGGCCLGLVTSSLYWEKARPVFSRVLGFLPSLLVGMHFLLACLCSPGLGGWPSRLP